MSGIVGCTGKEDVSCFLIQGLNRLEYLGYDSAGLALLQEKDLVFEKINGSVRLLTSRVNNGVFRGDTGVAGLRFATHGEPTRANAHPQLDCHGSVAVVHSGVIENYKEIKSRLLAEDHRFRSATDTEVLAHLVEGRLEGTGFLEVFLEIMNQVEGSLSFLAVDRHRPKEIFGGCSESGLWVGFGKDITIISSELAPLIAHTRKAVRVEPDSVVRVRGGEVEIYGKDGKRRDAEPKEIAFSLKQAQRGGYDFHTLKEICEQPISIRRAWSHRIGHRGVKLRNFGLPRRILKQVDLVRTTGNGSSFHAAMVAKHYIEDLVRVPTACIPASELLAADPSVSERSLLIAFSQSGRTSDTIQATQRWRNKGGKTLAVCNATGSPLWKASDGILGSYAGPEIGRVSTKTFTGSIVTAYLFAVTLGRAQDTIKSVPERELLYGLQRLSAVVDELIKRKPEIEDFAERLVQAKSVFFTGSGLNYSTALEGALKMKQLASIHSEGMPIGEMRHQILNLVGEDRPVVALALDGNTFELQKKALQEIKDAGGVVLALTGEGDRNLQDIADATFSLPSVGELLSPVPTIVVLQILALTVACRLGFDPDVPRNVKKVFD